MRSCLRLLQLLYIFGQGTLRTLKQSFKYCLVIIVSSQAMIINAEESIPLSSALHGLEFIAPQDRWALRLEYRGNAYNDIYTSNRQQQPLGAVFDGVNLDSNVFADLAAFGLGATLGTTVFSTDVSTKRLELTLGYGVTESLTVGIILPYGEVRTNASFAVTGGNIGFNPVPGGNPPLLPVGVGGVTAPVGTAGVQAILSNPAFGFAYKPLQSTTWSGVGDPTIGVLWRFHKSNVDSYVLGTGIRFGLADDVNIDDLLQIPIDDGNTDYRLRLEYYRNLGDGFDFKWVAAYTYQFDDNVTRRIPTAGVLLATAASKESLKRKLGNYWEYDIGIARAFGDWRYSGTWHRYVKQGDEFTSALGTNVAALENDTALFANQWRAAVSWSGIRAWQDGNFPLPLIVQLEVQETYEAQNFPNVRDIYLQLTSFF